MISLAIFALCWAIGCAAAAMLLLSPAEAAPQETEEGVPTLR
jgi:hypothetical protein